MKAKKIIIGIISAVLIAGITFFTICLVNCIVYRNTEKPWDIDNVVWYSENPEIEIVKDNNKYWEGYIVVDGNKVYVEILWYVSAHFDIVPLGTEIISDDIVLLSGTVIPKKDATDLEIKKDNVFNYQYKTITLYRKAIEE